MDNNLESFVDSILQTIDTSSLEADVVAEMKRDLLERAEDFINVSILRYMPEEKLPEFNTLIDGGDVQAIQQFTADNVPNLQEVVASALVDFRQTYTS